MELNIYLADDDPDDRELFKDAIQELIPHSKLFLFPSGSVLLDYLNDNRIFSPDIIFLDINMPMKNGKTCLKEMRKNKHFKHIPIIMFTTSMDDRDVKECFENGANLYVNKPVNYRNLMDVLNQILGIYATNQFFGQPKEQFVLTRIPFC